MEPGNDRQLKHLLDEWRVPNAPDALEQRLFRKVKPWWRNLMTSHVRVPFPVAIAFFVAMAWLAVVAVRDRMPVSEPLNTPYDLRGFQPVNSVNVRIERNSDATQ
jgi:hypothetical protein